MTQANAERMSGRDFLDRILDPDSYRTWDQEPIEVATSASYRDELIAAAERSGTDESVATGEGLLRGRRVAVIVCEFRFLAGSIGVAAAERIVAAVERATTSGLPLVASPTSGGTRMQEGTAAFLQMVKIAGAVAAHKSAGLPYLVYLRNPTMGGVFASWGSLGHMTFAQPGAQLGFLGPRVYETLYGRAFPEGVQTAENLYQHGVIDGVVPAQVFRRIAHRVLNVTSSAGSGASGAADRASSSASAAPPVWDSVIASRNPARPGIRDLLRQSTDRVPLSGTGQGESDRSVVHALARLRGEPCVVFGHDHVGPAGRTAMGPAALREARRSIRLAAELRLPLVLIIDTVGAALSREAEEHGLAPEIARCLADLVTVETPTVSVLLGQGSGGGALALLPADRVLAATNGWLAPLPPEGASAIVYRDADHAPELAVTQRICASDLYADGIVDRIVPELPDASAEPVDFARRMVTAIADELAALRSRPRSELVALRRQRYRRLGLPG